MIDEMPYPAGRHVFNKKEILKKILAAIEQWYYSSNTPQNKRIVVTGSGITRHVCFGTFKYSLNPDEQTYFRKVRTNVFRWLNVFATERAGNNSWQFTLDAIDNLKKEIELTPKDAEKKDVPIKQYYKQYRENNKEKIKQYNDRHRSKKKLIIQEESL